MLGLDGLRALAFLVVFWGHAPIWARIPGGVGVDLFFFLSGFLITTLLRREVETAGRVDLLGFYVRRAARILPPLWIAVAVTVAASAAGLIGDQWTPLGLAATLAFAANFVLADHHPALELVNVLPVWSLAIEEHYYLAFPAITLAAWTVTKSVRRVGLVVVGLWVVSTAWKVALLLTGHEGWRMYFGTDTNIDKLLAGSVVALLAHPLRDNLTWFRRLAPPLWPAALASFFLAGMYGQSVLFAIVRAPIQAACLTVVFWAVTAGRGSAVLESRPLVWLGSVSYSAYLLHLVALQSMPESLPGWAATAGALAATLTAAGLLSRFVEGPARRAARRLTFWGRWSPSVPPVGAIRP